MRQVRALIYIQVLIFVGGLLPGCHPLNVDLERNVITNSAPFYEVELDLSPNHAEEVIAAVRAFAKENDMDFLLAHKTLTPGEFNVSANSGTLNIKAMHVPAVGDKGVKVYAIARSSPTDNDRALVRDFICRIDHRCSSAINSKGLDHP